MKSFIVAMMLFAMTGVAMAESVFPPEVPFQSTKTRAEVKAELAAWVKAGKVGDITGA